MSARHVRSVVVFRVVTAPAFARCYDPECRAALAGHRAWCWRERDGTYGYGCRVHMFAARALAAAKEAA